MRTLMIIAALTLGGLTASTATAQQNPVKKEKTTTEEKIYDFTSLDTTPAFPKGMEAFYQYLASSLKYPEEAKKNNVEGKVFLSFIVEKDGKLSDVKVIKGLGYGTNEEAVRVVKASPNWNPGKIKGEAVRVQYNLPISFSLSKK